ncbi:MAG: efflux RND transporter periplasmic adaptor subunit [bacterium]|nr:efflux RND transporter periplasmic adaptor subunit [bacterium]
MTFIEKFSSLKRSHKIALLFVLIVGGRFVFHWVMPSSVPPQQKTELLKVEVLHSVAKMRQADVPLSGRTIVHRRVEVRAETKGQILERLIPEGANVQGGKPMVRLSIDERAAELAEAQAIVEQKRLEFEVAQKLLEKSFKSPTHLAQAKASFEGARAKLERIETTIRDTKIKAPFSGTLEQYHVDQGDYVKVGDRVAIFVQANPLKASFHASESQRLNLTLNQPCTLTIAEQTVKGFISQIRSLAEEKTKTFYGEVTLSEIPETFPHAEGFTVQILAQRPPQKIHTVSPAYLSLASDGTLGIKALDPQNRVLFLPIDLVKHTPEGVWVTGLPEKVSIITTGHEFAKEGEIVSPFSKSSKIASGPESVKEKT